MGGQSASEAIFIAVNHNITLVGKLWLLIMVFLRIFILIFAGYPLYQDEQERFVCNTIQPGCSNVCYDLFAPLSLFRFWLLQLTILCLPYLTFVTYIIHKVLSDIAVFSDASHKMKARSLIGIQQGSLQKGALSKARHIQAELSTLRTFTGAYITQLLLRILFEAGFGAANYYLFGFYIPKRFLCQQSPCTTTVDCYVSRPTEKTVMLNFMLGTAGLSLLLNGLDMICAIKRSVRQKSKRKMLVRNMYEEEQFYLSPGGSQGAIDANVSAVEEMVASVASGSFRKRGMSKSSRADLEDAPCGRGTPLVPGMLGPTNAHSENNVYPIPALEECPDREGSEVALCPTEQMGTPRPIRVSKRSRLKPPPPPRRDNPPGAGSVDVVPGATALCTRRVGHYTLVEMSGVGLPSCSGDNQEKRSEWV
ncbi:gap junction delta-4 protein [Clupea harengus]|uniref:Gap junction protein n=1 Tax=Clupea harengus TaxID=7950 RepID=A0A6P3VQQ8_CLUHA|nr:gap junction delta-4 protein [Clupea harengus]